MIAQRLRDAAKVLRGRAEAARAGRWDACGTEVEADRGTWSAVVATCHGSLAEGNVVNAAYIATMSPPVALALADWLDVAGADHFAFGDPVHHAADHEPCWDCDDDPRAPHMRASLRVADLILGAE